MGPHKGKRVAQTQNCASPLKQILSPELLPVTAPCRGLGYPETAHSRGLQAPKLSLREWGEFGYVRGGTAFQAECKGAKGSSPGPRPRGQRATVPASLLRPRLGGGELKPSLAGPETHRGSPRPHSKAGPGRNLDQASWLRAWALQPQAGSRGICRGDPGRQGALSGQELGGRVPPREQGR